MNSENDDLFYSPEEFKAAFDELAEAHDTALARFRADMVHVDIEQRLVAAGVPEVYRRIVASALREFRSLAVKHRFKMHHAEKIARAAQRLAEALAESERSFEFCTSGIARMERVRESSGIVRRWKRVRKPISILDTSLKDELQALAGVVEAETAREGRKSKNARAFLKQRLCQAVDRLAETPGIEALPEEWRPRRLDQFTREDGRAAYGNRALAARLAAVVLGEAVSRDAVGKSARRKT